MSKRTTDCFTNLGREHWTGEMSADEWVPVIQAISRPLVI